MPKNITERCFNCGKNFIITAEEQKAALQKGGLIKRKYCRECLLKWREGKIKLNKNKK